MSADSLRAAALALFLSGPARAQDLRRDVLLATLDVRVRGGSKARPEPQEDMVSDLGPTMERKGEKTRPRHEMTATAPAGGAHHTPAVGSAYTDRPPGTIEHSDRREGSSIPASRDDERTNRPCCHDFDLTNRQ